MRKIRVLIADDHTVLRDGIRALLDVHEDMEVVGDAEDGVEAVEKASQLKPDVVLMDIAMPRLGGLEAALELRQRKLLTKVIVLTQYDNKEYILQMLKAGAAGYILKKAAGTELVSAIRAVHAGESFLHPSVAKTVIDRYLQEGEEDEVERRLDQLTDREKEILKLLGEGRSNREIAELLYLSAKTVTHHRASIMEKLEIHNRTELVKFAIRAGLVDVGR
ncbi:MAG: DNA-binding response regulator [Chloroflexi bacterium RBG_13_60_13]|nr:MAG: DNA-binding response regulator [Chloroflexi bacterium RBG_13_60_13]